MILSVRGQPKMVKRKYEVTQANASEWAKVMLENAEPYLNSVYG
jgi:hypothetical protein